MARTVIDLCMNELNDERKQRHHVAAIRVCENVTRCLVRTNIPGRDEVMARLAELRKRLGV
jgi:hypothetical protein